MKDLRARLEAEVVGPIFGTVGRKGHRDQSLPEVVFENRRKRAYGRVLDALASRGVPSFPPDKRTRLESMVEAWSTKSFDDGFRPIQEFEEQCARERDLVVAQESGDPRKVLEIQERDYRRRVIERFGSIELRGIQLNHRVILDLEQVYVPLHFEELPSRAMAAAADGSFRVSLAKEPRRRAIDEILKEHASIFLIGAPGSGKSTLVSFLASSCAAGSHQLNLPPRPLPLVITVREVKDAAIGPAWLASQLAIPEELVRAALKEGRAVLLIDGLDEAPEQLRDELLTGLLRFTEAYRMVPVIVTSRPSAAPGEIESCLPGFRGFRVAELTNEEVGSFIDKWCLAAERSARSDSDEAERKAAEAAADLKARIARSRPVERIATNPLLTTILCVVHRFLGRTIPEHRVTLYEKCTDALLYEWDRAKFDRNAAVGNLDANQKRALLRGVASALHEKHEAEMPEEDVVRHFAATLPELGQPQEDALRIVREIRDRSGVLVERRPGAFAFSHLTFQEYLTALDYASRTDELLQHADDPWWHEVIALAAGIPGCDAARIIRTFLNRQPRKKEDVWMAAKCLETGVTVPLDIRTQVEQALGEVLPGEWRDTPRLLEIGLSVAPILAKDFMTYDKWAKGCAWDFFESFHYEPLVPVLVQLASDGSKSNRSLALSTKQKHEYALSNGELAVWFLCKMANTSERAKAAAVSVLSKEAYSDEFLDFLKPWEKTLGDDFKPSRRGKRSSTRAKNTA